ncbi:PQQ-dependent sugar dehydrogenase [Fictibacillus barbaricus]|uniref:Glucose/arabinose dehydrogenase n=1 Tax=Fictibacillus barbaricus TaxID=182136 RepID=A0ABU1U4G1_9BACL|nr:PQQ-dependent sugar dehydrogenase [Fictibacillus barbaricus]MDR7074337.1 glucose/arabinose dehydrogenase [Fictibacillus barbaricus]
MLALKRFILTLISILFLSGCFHEEKNTSEKNEKDAAEVLARQAEVVATDLVIPWNINKQDNTFYSSQRPGYIIKVDSTKGSKTVQNVEVLKKVLHEGEGGLLGFILAPDFENSREAFAYHTYKQDGNVYNRIIVLKLDQNKWTEKNMILEKIPGGRIHNGGRIKIGPDGKLYATAGDAGNPENAQNVNSLAGKILRMELDGSVPNDNPYEKSYVYSYGHRNPQGLAWDQDERLYSSEHGQMAHDEINLIEPRKNYGWPIIEGNEQAPAMVSPLFQSGDNTWAPSGMAIKNKQIYVASLRGERILVIDLADKEVITFFEDAGRMRDMLIEDNALYTITNNRDGRGTPREGDDKLLKLPLGE